MELRHLRYFVAVAEELHFRRAAERLHVAQPAVSEQIRKLEAELGVRLLDRTHRSVSLTDAGAALLEEARGVLEQAEAARLAARNARDQAGMRLRIGYLPDSLPPSVPRTLLHLSSAAPKVQVQLGTGPALRLIEDLRARRLDAVVANLPAPTSGLRVTSLGSQRPIAALPVTDARAMAPGLTAERLAPERLVVLPRDANPAFHNAVVSLCRDAGVAPTLVEVSEPRVELALLAVAAGAGVALLPASAAGRYATPGVRLVELEGVEDAFESALLTRPDDDRFATASLLRALARSTHGSEPVPERPPLRVAS